MSSSMVSSVQMPQLSNNITIPQFALIFAFLLGATLIVSKLLTAGKPVEGFPVVALTEQGLGAKESWFRKGRETIERGIAKYNAPFQVITGTGPKICLPNRFAEELKQHPSVSLFKAFAQDFFATYPGFGPFSNVSQNEHWMPEVVRVKLTQSLGLITHDLVDETTLAVHDLYGEDTEWREETLKPNIQKLVARLSSRIFLGTRLCRNERWLQVARDYTVDVFAAAVALRRLPAFLRPVLYWTLPECMKLRKDYADAEKLITPEVVFRKKRARTALTTGEKLPKSADVIGWMYEVAGERRDEFNYVDGQLSLTLAAIHTTSEALCGTLLNIMSHPEIVEPLRKETTDVVGAFGWTKQTLYRLRLMDSVLRESARLSIFDGVSMQRLAVRALTLSDGSVIPAGTRVMVAKKTHDPTTFPDPHKFHPYRFLKDREKCEETDQPSTSLHVSVTAEHMAWGYGEHGCPGRFFASNEMKIALAHLLLKYDWKRSEDGGPAFVHVETTKAVSPRYKIMFRRRKEEINLALGEGVTKSM